MNKTKTVAKCLPLNFSQLTFVYYMKELSCIELNNQSWAISWIWNKLLLKLKWFSYSISFFTPWTIFSSVSLKKKDLEVMTWQAKCLERWQTLHENSFTSAMCKLCKNIVAKPGCQKGAGTADNLTSNWACLSFSSFFVLPLTSSKARIS